MLKYDTNSYILFRIEREAEHTRITFIPMANNMLSFGIELLLEALNMKKKQ